MRLRVTDTHTQTDKPNYSIYPRCACAPRVIVHLLEAADRQYGVANQSYVQYVLERREICLQTCRTLKRQFTTPSDSNGRLQWYLYSIEELISCLWLIRRKWEEYQSILDSGLHNEALAFCVPVVHTGRQGRPRFDVTKEQLEYLSSFSFTWSEIVALLGVSRTTIFRYVAGIEIVSFLTVYMPKFILPPYVYIMSYSTVMCVYQQPLFFCSRRADWEA